MDPSFEFDRRDHEQEIDLMANLLFETRRSLDAAASIVDSVPVDAYGPVCSRITTLKQTVTSLEMELEKMTT